jgi:hypothetical protein
MERKGGNWPICSNIKGELGFELARIGSVCPQPSLIPGPVASNRPAASRRSPSAPRGVAPATPRVASCQRRVIMAGPEMSMKAHG